MNFNLSKLPKRNIKPRENGITMVIDKGMGTREIEDWLKTAHPHVDLVKFGFGTSVVIENLEEKIKIFNKFNIPFYFGGTLFEYFILNESLNKYLDIIERYNIKVIEVSDGSIKMDHKEKCEIINKLSKKYIIFSEIGRKNSSEKIYGRSLKYS